jgi:hypothetical protein
LGFIFTMAVSYSLGHIQMQGLVDFRSFFNNAPYDFSLLRNRKTNLSPFSRAYGTASTVTYSLSFLN